MLSPSIKSDFPIFSAQEQKGPFVYLDSAACAQMPQQVRDAVAEYETEFHASVHRGMYAIAEKATAAYETARATVAQFIGAKMQEIVFTKNTTEALNIVIAGISEQLARGDEVVVSRLDHHSNIVPWQNAAKKYGLILKYLETGAGGAFDQSSIDRTITPATRVVSVSFTSNATGEILPITEIIARAKSVGAFVIFDAAQTVPHRSVDVKMLDCDFMAFGGHKMLAPTGIGVLYGKKELLDRLPPILYGGGMIDEVRDFDARWTDTPWKFEAGTPNVAGAVGIGAAVEYLRKIGMTTISAHEKELMEYALARLQEMEWISIWGPKTTERRDGILSFESKKIPPHDMATILSREGVCVRTGHHCAMPLMKKLGISGTVRASVYLYNTREDIDALMDGMQTAKKIFGV